MANLGDINLREGMASIRLDGGYRSLRYLAEEHREASVVRRPSAIAEGLRMIEQSARRQLRSIKRQVEGTRDRGVQ